MASSNFTPNLGLCSWLAEDSPKRADFVSDNMRIDEVLGGHVENTSIHLSAEEKQKALNPATTVSYQGDGNTQKTISGFSAPPKFAVVFKKNAPPVALENGELVVNIGFGSYGGGFSSGVAVTGTGIIVNQDAAAINGVKRNLNEKEEQYLAVVF